MAVQDFNALDGFTAWLTTHTSRGDRVGWIARAFAEGGPDRLRLYTHDEREALRQACDEFRRDGGAQ